MYPHGGPTGRAEDYFDRTAAALASRGYMVIQPNFRGSTGCGRAFQLANVGDLGGGDLKDLSPQKTSWSLLGTLTLRRSELLAVHMVDS